MLCLTANGQYLLYHSAGSHSVPDDIDCLFAYQTESGASVTEPHVPTYYLVPYCRRLDSNEISQSSLSTDSPTIARIITFEELKRHHVTSSQLLAWSAPLDVAESYDMNENISHQLFFNCTPPWFGAMCQYTFGYEESISFSEIVVTTFDSYHYSALENLTTGTCYLFLKQCRGDAWPICLDWREICDGKFDCPDGEDELPCNALEYTKCKANEYRCHYGGQCIPLDFLHENRFQVDCLDGSDEAERHVLVSLYFNHQCTYFTSFMCEDRTSRYKYSFQCGNGEFHFQPVLSSQIGLCGTNRDETARRQIFSTFDHITDVSCRQALQCVLHHKRFYRTSGGPVHDREDASTVDKESTTTCPPLTEHCSEPWLTLTEYPIVYDYFHFVYFTNRSISKFQENIAPDLICFHPLQCPVWLAVSLLFEVIPGLKCCYTSELVQGNKIATFAELDEQFLQIHHDCTKLGKERNCTNSAYFHCSQSSRCLMYHRVGDGYFDCNYGEDELFPACQLNDSSRFACKFYADKCLQHVAIGNDNDDCPDGQDELIFSRRTLEQPLPYPTFCNQVEELLLDGEDNSDETDCHVWPCHNAYTHCTRRWECANGLDEANCAYLSCPTDHLYCYNETIDAIYCLPRALIYERHLEIDCTDYPIREVFFSNDTVLSNSSNYFSWNNSKCITLDMICPGQFPPAVNQTDVCLYQYNFAQFLLQTIQVPNTGFKQCDPKASVYVPPPPPYLKAQRLGYFPPLNVRFSTYKIIPDTEVRAKKSYIDVQNSIYCHRGILIFQGHNKTKACLCPPSYFGSRCQWQNQRISLTLQFKLSDASLANIVFQIIILLIDEQGNINPHHETLIYIPALDCDTKFNLYLLYPDRPKQLSKNYSIRVDVFNKLTLEYWTSWRVPIPFQFLPVNRISTQLFIPHKNQPVESCTLNCGRHGKCSRYHNTESSFYCRCDPGYSGMVCDIAYPCQCSNDSLCHSPSVCVCPLHKFGRRCYLRRSISHNTTNPCLNEGIYAPQDDRIDIHGFRCLCKEGYSGDRCQNSNYHVSINLDETIIAASSWIFLHFIIIFRDKDHQRITSFKKVPYGQSTITVYVESEFNILFTETTNRTYYLAFLRETFMPSERLQTRVAPKQRCSKIQELMNDTFLQLKTIQRVKYYPLLCRQNPEVMCFYDESYMCVCDVDRFANCFWFNHTMSNDCQGYNDCQNGGQCFRNNDTCPTLSICVCSECFYGAKCQFSTKSYILSLDPILGYQIKPNSPLGKQPFVVQMTAGFVMFIIAIGCTSASISIITFWKKNTRSFGFSYYLLIGAVLCICLISLLAIKFWLLVHTQIGNIHNRWFLTFSCVMLDMLLRSLLASNEWLNACVTVERTLIAIQGVNFNKVRSVTRAKWIIFFVVVVTICSHIHDPLHRQLIDDLDGDEKRIWCFARYTPAWSFFNAFVTFAHFLAPFLINIILTAVMVWFIAQLRSRMQHSKETFRQQLRQQLNQYQHLFIGPTILVLLGLPRLIISFMNHCMKSQRNPWLFLIGYLVAYVPSISGPAIFIFSSSHYRSEFLKTIRHFIRRLSHRV